MNTSSKPTTTTATTPNLTTCALCGKPASATCQGCLCVAYCSKTCQVQHWKQGTTGGGHKSACRQLALEAYLQLLQEFTHHADGKPLEDWLQMLGRYAERGLSFPSPEDVKLFEFFSARAQTCVKYQPKLALPVRLLVLSSLVLATLHKKSPYVADCERRVQALANALQNAQELHSFSGVGPHVLDVAARVLRKLEREEEAAALLEKHVSLVEASDIVRPTEKVNFLCDATQWLYSDRFGRAELVQMAKKGLMAKRVAQLACQVFQRRTEVDKRYTLYRTHIQAGGSLKSCGEWQESLLYSQKALEFSRLIILSPPDKRAMDSVYLYECEAHENLAEILCNLGRVGEAETLLRSGLQTQLDRVANLPYSYELAKGLQLIRGQLVELLMRCLGRYEEAYEQLQQLRQDILPLLNTHAADKETINNIKMHGIGQYWPKASECLFKLGREDEAYRWDEEVLEHASDFLVFNRFDAGPNFSFIPSISAARLKLRDWERRRRAEGETGEKMCWQTRFWLVAAVRCEAARLTGYAIGRDKQPYYTFHLDRERVAQQLLVSFAKQLLSATVLEEKDYIEEVSRIAYVYEADLEENRRIEEGLREAVLEQVREEIIAARCMDEAAKELGEIKLNKTMAKKKKKRGGRRGKKEYAGAAGSSKGGEVDVPDDKDGEKEEDTAAKEADVVTDRDCSICLTEMSLYDDEEEEDEQEKTVTLACQHRFHSSCVELWTSGCASKGITPSCPMCRETL